MTGSSLVPIVTPIVALIALACWIAAVYWADAHPRWKSSGAAPRADITGAATPPAVAGQEAHRGGHALSPQDKSAA